VITLRYIYLHGFASSPNSAKAQYLRSRFAQSHIDLAIPDLNAGDFSHLTITRQIQQVASEFLSHMYDVLAPQSQIQNGVTLIGSSLGGLTAVHLGQHYPQVQRLILLAPAFGFLSHWLPTLGNEKLASWQQEKYLMVYHYGEGKHLPLCYDFVMDARQYQEETLQRSIPTLILHGKNDEVIPIQASDDYAQKRPWVNLVELNSNHSLDNVMTEIWQAIKLFCHIS
jgi:pimeloyl-ACP methyl ester carboxylesterase